MNCWEHSFWSGWAYTDQLFCIELLTKEDQEARFNKEHPSTDDKDKEDQVNWRGLQNRDM
jgi:hypothetical protein